MKLVANICAFGLAAALSSSGGELLLADRTDYYTFNPISGEQTYLATGALDSVSNFSFVVDSEHALAFQMGKNPGSLSSNGISITDLVTGDTQNFQFQETSIPHFAGMWNGKLILVDDSEYWSFDPQSGTETHLATGSLDRVVNFSCMVNPETGIVYEGGSTNGLDAISVTNLDTGQSRSIATSKTRHAQFGGFWNGNLIIAEGQKFYSFDEETGEETLLATGSLNSIANFSFVVDPATGIAYQAGRLSAGGGNAANGISVTDLMTGQTQNFSVLTMSIPDFAGIYSAPVPAKSLEPITSIIRSGSRLRLEIPLATRRKIGVEYSQNLSPGSWVQLGNFFEEDGVGVFLDPDQTRVNRETGYYRAFLRPLAE